MESPCEKQLAKLDEILVELKRLNEYFSLLNECCQEASRQRDRTNDSLKTIKERV